MDLGIASVLQDAITRWWEMEYAIQNAKTMNVLMMSKTASVMMPMNVDRPGLATLYATSPAITQIAATMKKIAGVLRDVTSSMSKGMEFANRNVIMLIATLMLRRKVTQAIVIATILAERNTKEMVHARPNVSSQKLATTMITTAIAMITSNVKHNLMLEPVSAM